MFASPNMSFPTFGLSVRKERTDPADHRDLGAESGCGHSGVGAFSAAAVMKRMSTDGLAGVREALRVAECSLKENERNLMRSCTTLPKTTIFLLIT